MSDSWTIQMGDGSKPVRIGKFDDSVNLAQAAPPVRMWEELEPVIEDDPAHEEEKRPQDFRKNRRRHAFKRKTRLMLKDSGKKTNGQLNLVATPDDTANKYALLKVSQSSTGERFLNVIPVDSWWSFKRPAVGQVRTLEEVDAKVEERKQQLAKERKRYIEKFRRGAQEDDKDEEYAEPIYGTGTGRKSSGKAAASDAARPLGLGDAGEDLEEVAEWKESFQGEGDEYLHHSNDEGDLSADDSVAEEEKEKPADAYDLHAGDSSEESEEEEEEEEEEGDEQLDELAQGSRQVRELLRAQKQAEATKTAEQPAKRPREGDQKEETAKRPKRDELVAELTEDNVRKFMMLHGAKMRTKELLKAFKRVADKPAAKEKFKNILEKITRLEEDPQLGKVFSLKDAHRRW